MTKNFKAVGISFRNTPLAIRESVTFDEQQNRQFLFQLKETFGLEEALVLSTCNRTEVFYSSERELSQEIPKLIDIFHQSNSSHYFKKFNHQEAIQHLFEVVLGLDSMVLGDIQITNQVKKAYQYSTDENMAGPFLHRLSHTIFFTNKRMVQETTFRDGNASVTSSAVSIAEQFIAHYEQPRILVIGIGEIGSVLAENLKEVHAQVILSNRTHSKAVSKAGELGFKVVPFDQIIDEIERSHVIISSVQSSKPIIRYSDVSSQKHPQLFIDLGLPRSIDSRIESLPESILYNIDQLNEKASETLERRKAAIADVRKIISESVNDLDNWSQELEVSPTIKKLKQALEDIRKQEMARYINKLDDEHAEIMDKATKNMIQKVIKLPVLQLKAACKRGEAETLVDVLNDLFNLEKENSPKEG